MFEEKVLELKKILKATKLGNHPLALKLCDSSSTFPILIPVPYIQPFGKYKDNVLVRRNIIRQTIYWWLEKQTCTDVSSQFKIPKLGASVLLDSSILIN